MVVADNFEEIVNNPSKDMLLEFYAPWCKSLEPKYTELGEQVRFTSASVAYLVLKVANHH